MNNQKLCRNSKGSFTGCTVGLLSCVVFAALSSGCATSSANTRDFTGGESVHDDFDAGIQRPPSAKTLYALAQLLLSRGKYQESRFVLIRTTREHPAFAPAYSELAGVELRLGKLDRAIAALSQGLSKAPRDAVLLNNLGMCWMAKADYSQAARYFEKAAATVPNSRYVANHALAVGMLGRYGQSLALYKKIMGPADARHNLAVIQKSKADLERLDLKIPDEPELPVGEELIPPAGPKDLVGQAPKIVD